MALLGANVSIAGGLEKAFARGRAIGCEALQIFVKSPRLWRGKSLSERDISAFREAHTAEPLPVVAHGSYLINLAATDAVTLERSRAALADELLRCDALGLRGLVLHPGAHLDAGEEAGLARIACSLDHVFAAHPGIRSRVLLENTAGQGTALGYRLEQLHSILKQVAAERVEICLDTCHAFAAGYALHEERGYQALFTDLEDTVSLARLGCVHLNDSKAPFGSRKDRHANIGAGAIGLPAFARIVHDERFAGLPMILETPMGVDGLGHQRDLKLLRVL